MKKFVETLFPIPIDLQFFAEGDEGISDQGEAADKTQQEQGETGNPNQKLFSQEEMDQTIAKRLKREQEKIKKEVEQELRLKNMSKEEREREEFDRLKKEMDQYKREAHQAKMEKYATRNLRDMGVPIEFAGFLIGEDEEHTLDNLKSFKYAWDTQLATVVKSRIGGSTPDKPSGGESKEIDPLLAAFDKGFKY
ncbi:DUF4355 domain-containing protein [Brevibacillus laterosporus]|uniref:DUF4355 domain-containing protein n=1 Tax=Brevibacillus laterosporus TaxID=1465 RepID=UPI0013158AC8|nr:DUF4355 domain-containing protein [Brevibacillus laterosporus]